MNDTTETILVVDDVASVRETFREWLESAGLDCRILTAADGVAARKLLETDEKVDLLLTDAFFHLVKDLRHGRLDYDSVTLRKDTVLPDSVYTQALASANYLPSCSQIS